MESKATSSNKTLFSPNYHSREKRAWFLLRILLKQLPHWAKEYKKSKVYIFREIAYVDKNNKLIGLGRSYLPLNPFGIKILFNCLITAKPLGVFLKKKYFNILHIDVISSQPTQRNLSPFINEISQVNAYQRILSIGKKEKIIVEEDFML